MLPKEVIFKWQPEQKIGVCHMMNQGDWVQHDMMYHSVNKDTEVNLHGEWEF